jgi:ornithine cyclodeaminase
MKLVSIRSDNPLDGLPLVPATILTVDAKTGIVDAVVAGTYLTAARTAAGSALATAHALGRPGRTRTLEHLVVFGAGLQAELHVQAIATALTPTAHEEEEGPSSSSSSSSLSAIPIRKIPKLTLVNRNLDRARQLAGQLVDWCGDIQVVELSDDLGVADALSTANVIVTATNTVTPLFSHSSGLIPSGCHINGIGSYTPSMQEVPCRFVSDRCTVWVDTNEARQVGDLQALSPNHPCHLFGRVLLEQEQEPSWPHLDCTFYKAVGTAIQDVMTADLVVRRARELNLGTAIDMS